MIRVVIGGGLSLAPGVNLPSRRFSRPPSLLRPAIANAVGSSGEGDPFYTQSAVRYYGQSAVRLWSTVVHVRGVKGWVHWKFNLLFHLLPLWRRERRRQPQSGSGAAIKVLQVQPRSSPM